MNYNLNPIKFIIMNIVENFYIHYNPKSKVIVQEHPRVFKTMVIEYQKYKRKQKNVLVHKQGTWT